MERCFIRDGILNEAGYLITSPKICFLLKETYGDFTDIVKTAEDLNGLSKRMFSVMGQYAYVINAAWHRQIYDVQALTSLAPTVNHVGYVEVKKVSGEPVSTAADLNRYAERDAAFLQTQLALIAPEVLCRHL
ncbi:MAG: hypothetical protein ACTTI6_11995 [Treponema sp.]|uniref:hypothetical protein n=1 Tax=Treponema sp. TaxID=166 RepID=UPI003FA23F11